MEITKLRLIDPKTKKIYEYYVNNTYELEYFQALAELKRIAENESYENINKLEDFIYDNFEVLSITNTELLFLKGE